MKRCWTPTLANGYAKTNVCGLLYTKIPKAGHRLFGIARTGLSHFRWVELAGVKEAARIQPSEL
jgi:hypothetical protein